MMMYLANRYREKLLNKSRENSVMRNSKVVKTVSLSRKKGVFNALIFIEFKH